MSRKSQKTKLEEYIIKKAVIRKEKYYSVCCGILMPYYPDSDFCPECHNHTDIITEEQYKKEGGE